MINISPAEEGLKDGNHGKRTR